ncbi:8-oxo-dGTP diphosphatase MutT, partial [Klebsiella pneumoniae]|uniref:8-oxo-dGTP diphosphatase MutT n=1 Tax=Klebsiella pneumoniae TaxID=573 RepID=UPI003919EC23
MKKLQIAVGIIRNPQGEIFITQRAADAHMANKLEFPGGKIESDETPEQALIRELQEEVGITVTASSLFDKLECVSSHRYCNCLRTLKEGLPDVDAAYRCRLFWVLPSNCLCDET